MTKLQKRSLSALEAAFKLCGDAGLAFYGMDNDLLVVSARAVPPSKSLHEAENECPGISQRVNTHRAYRDSGGW